MWLLLDLFIWWLLFAIALIDASHIDWWDLLLLLLARSAFRSFAHSFQSRSIYSYRSSTYACFQTLLIRTFAEWSLRTSYPSPSEGKTPPPVLFLNPYFPQFSMLSFIRSKLQDLQKNLTVKFLINLHAANQSLQQPNLWKKHRAK